MDNLIFRVWHKKRKKLYRVLHLHLASQEGPWATCEGFDIIEQKEINIQIQPEDCVVEQFVGLLDQNGKKIFVGDIYEITDGDEWVVGSGVAEMQDGEMMHQDCIGNVVGNVHETPELIPAV